MFSEIFIRVSFKSSRGIDKDLIDVPDFFFIFNKILRKASYTVM